MTQFHLFLYTGNRRREDRGGMRVRMLSLCVQLILLDTHTQTPKKKNLSPARGFCTVKKVRLRTHEKKSFSGQGKLLLLYMVYHYTFVHLQQVFLYILFKKTVTRD